MCWYRRWKITVKANIYWGLKYTRHSSKHVKCMNSFNPPFNHIRRALLESSFCRGEAWKTEKLSELHGWQQERKCTHLIAALTEIFRGFRIKWLKEYGVISGNRVFREKYSLKRKYKNPLLTTLLDVRASDKRFFFLIQKIPSNYWHHTQNNFLMSIQKILAILSC